MNQEHVLNQISDYVLDLLPRQERRWVEQHTAVCPHCRQQLHRESELSHLMRATLKTATQPSSVRLRHLMPPQPPRPQAICWPFTKWTKQWVLAALLFVMLWSGVTLYQRQFSQIGAPPDQLAVTATMTQDPTMTLASLEEKNEAEAVTTAVPQLILEPSATPEPIPTPIAALAPLSLN